MGIFKPIEEELSRTLYCSLLSRLAEDVPAAPGWLPRALLRSSADHAKGSSVEFVLIWNYPALYLY